MRIGIVISNHGAEPETEKMMREQFKLDKVRYYKHPDIDPRADKWDVWLQAFNFLKKHKLLNDRRIAVASINGEYGFSVGCVLILRANRAIEDIKNYRVTIICVYPTSERGATEELQKDGTIKTTHVYKFVQFREW